MTSGFDAPYIPGWDCHGLPIEHQIEKVHGKVNDRIDANRFRRECRKYALKQVERQKKDFIRLGVLGRWDKPYLTMNYDYEANMIQVLGQIIENGHLTKGFKPVHWCIDCGSALAEAEVEYKDKVSPAVDVKFKAEVPADWADAFAVSQLGKAVYAVIWTTTPWTLPANQAVAMHKEIDYALVDIGDEYIIVARDLVESLAAQIGLDQASIVATTPGEKLLNLTVHHPFYSRIVPIIHGDHVSSDSGTGLVHTAPAHGVEDFMVGREYGLPIDNPVDGNGCYLEHVEHFAGNMVFDTNTLIVEMMRTNNTLLHSAKINHSYAHCWRHKTPLIFRATPQWFISME
ncbi:MAG: class I tRNA ligase family protein, partial [Anaerohalosphaeraceae bacterium]